MQKQIKRTPRQSRRNSATKQVRSQRSNSLKKPQEIANQQIFRPTQIIANLNKIYEKKKQRQEVIIANRKYADQIYDLRHSIKNLQEYCRQMKLRIQWQLKNKKSISNGNKQDSISANQNTFFEETQQKIAVQSTLRSQQLKKLLDAYVDSDDSQDIVENNFIDQQPYLV